MTDLRSVLANDEAADLTRVSENDIGAIAHHGCLVISAALDLGDGGALLCLQIMAKTIKN